MDPCHEEYRYWVSAAPVCLGIGDLQQKEPKGACTTYTGKQKAVSFLKETLQQPRC